MHVVEAWLGVVVDVVVLILQVIAVDAGATVLAAC
jgi:hypothetical protein